MLQEFIQEMKSLLGGDNYGPVIKKRTITGGVDLVAGTILGIETASGNLKAYAAGNVDGSENPVAWLGADAAAAAADVEANVVYASVYVKRNMTGLDAAGEAALDALGIYANE